ncbi:hypothetical protein C4J94_3401 [Pseudomonas sp. R5-89-07]|nr:hypothetical protein C4J94_3401 [Pseudomonas sp. R5-89-07]
MAGLQSTSVKKAYPMADKLEELPFVEQMNTNETIFSHYLNLPSPG